MAQKYVTLSEVRDMLEDEARQRELSPDQRLALDHAARFAKVDGEKAAKIVEELRTVQVVNEYYAVKIADVMPAHPDDVRAIFQRERYTLSEEDTTRILEIVLKHQ
ncbi:MAG TPA: RNA polymerase Rpb4 family protein [Thermoplasmata archaeon]|jgi:DNA-directed RNA polymerase subunit F|nr:RNA polymerase Rpb4 family protein [Thermoplasmata archaeon]